MADRWPPIARLQAELLLHCVGKATDFVEKVTVGRAANAAVLPFPDECQLAALARRNVAIQDGEPALRAFVDTNVLVRHVTGDPPAQARRATALLASGDFHRPYLAPPSMRPETVRLLREAFNKTMKDPDFLADTKRKKLEINPTTGEEVEALTKELMSQPEDVVEKLKKLMGK